MPGIREVASEAGGEDVTRALRRPCSGVPRGEAARVARAPPRPPAHCAHRLAPASRTPTSWARRAHPTLRSRASPHLRLGGLGGAGGGRSGSGLFWASPRSGRGPAGGRSASCGGGGSGVPRRPGFGVRSHHDRKVTALPAPLGGGRRGPGRDAWGARLGGAAGQDPGQPRPLRAPRPRQAPAPPPLPLPGWQRWSGQGRPPAPARPALWPARAAAGEGSVLSRTLEPLPHPPLLRRTSDPRGQGLAQGDRKSTRLNSSHRIASRMPSSA